MLKEKETMKRINIGWDKKQPMKEQHRDRD